MSGRRLLRAEPARVAGETDTDVTADEVLGNIDAMTWAVESLSTAEAVTVDGLLRLHECLLARTRLREHAGRIRSVQNWIGGSSFNPCSAALVPPPPDHIEELLDDLCAFVNDDSLPAVAQAAIAHAQFETIHPFVESNSAPGAPSSTSCSAGEASHPGSSRRSRSCSRPGRGPTSKGSPPRVGLFAAACRRSSC